jgi:hypothetical protein
MTSPALHSFEPNEGIPHPGNLRAVQILLGHTKIESSVRDLGVDIEDALALSEEPRCGGPPISSASGSEEFLAIKLSPCLRPAATLPELVVSQKQTSWSLGRSSPNRRAN